MKLKITKKHMMDYFNNYHKNGGEISIQVFCAAALAAREQIEPDAFVLFNVYANGEKYRADKLAAFVVSIDKWVLSGGRIKRPRGRTFELEMVPF